MEHIGMDFLTETLIQFTLSHITAKLSQTLFVHAFKYYS